MKYVFQVEDSSHQRVEDFGAGGVEEAHQGAEEGGVVAEEALEEGRRSWLSHTDTKVCITPVFSYSGFLLGTKSLNAGTLLVTTVDA